MQDAAEAQSVDERGQPLGLDVEVEAGAQTAGRVEPGEDAAQQPSGAFGDLPREVTEGRVGAGGGVEVQEDGDFGAASLVERQELRQQFGREP
ncbi:hypothetical protein GCM10020254_16320 [Streptomyces goshikiensis]